jgi:phosphate transport system substrate-binding protein
MRPGTHRVHPRASRYHARENVLRTKEYSPVAKKIRMATAAAALVPLALLAAACGSSGGGSSSGSSSAPSASASSSSAGVSLTETGSTLVFPLFGAWQTAYNTDVTNVTITGSGTGSGTGIADAATGTVTMGASDAYLSSSDISQYPGLVNIPVAVASVMVNYNVPGVRKPLNLDGKVLTAIYTGKIKNWNDPAIKALNPGVNLPALAITTLHRAESSGSTFLFTSYLNAQDSANWPTTAVGTTVSWPSGAKAQAETGSGGMVTGCQSIKGCIAYIGISYKSKTDDAGLGEASLGNKAGKFTQPTSDAVAAALASFGTIPASGSQSLINSSDPKGYPIVNYEYMIVKKQQPSSATADALKAFLKWTITDGADPKFLDAVGFEPLPDNVATVSQNLISGIST